MTNGVSFVGIVLADKRDMTAWMIAAQTLTDLLFSVYLVPIFWRVLQLGEWYTGQTFCFSMGCTIHLLACASILSLDAMTYVRYCIIMGPTRSWPRMTPRRMKRIYYGAWAFAVVYATFPLYGDGNYVFHPSGLVCYADTGISGWLLWTCGIIGGSAIFMAYAYTKMILEVVRVRARGARAAQAMVRRASAEVRATAAREAAAKIKREVAILKMMLALVAVFWCNWGFAFAQFLIGMTGNQVPPICSVLTALFTIINSAINPVLYASMNKQFRALVAATLSRLCHRTAGRMGWLAGRRRKVMAATSVAASTVTSRNLELVEHVAGSGDGDDAAAAPEAGEATVLDGSAGESSMMAVSTKASTLELVES